MRCQIPNSNVKLNKHQARENEFWVDIAVQNFTLRNKLGYLGRMGKDKMGADSLFLCRPWVSAKFS